MGERTAKIRRTTVKVAATTLCLIIVLLPTIFGGNVAYAADTLTPPDLLEIKGAWVYRHLIETDDFLVMLHYNIQYDDVADIPDDPANKVFFMRLMSIDDTEGLGVTTPYPFYLSGYGEGVAAIYLSADEAPTWGEAYVLHIEGNPTKWETPPIIKYTLASSDYSAFNTTEENRVQLGTEIVQIALDLEVAWDVPGELVYATDVGTVFTLTGETYFLGAIPGLRVMAPSVFALQTEDVDWDYQTHDPSQAEEYEQQYDNTDIGEGLNAFGELFGVSPRLITGILLVFVMLIVMVISSVKYQTSTPGLLVSGVIIIGGTLMGLFPMAVMAIITFLIILFIGYTFYFKSASG